MARYLFAFRSSNGRTFYAHRRNLANLAFVRVSSLSKASRSIPFDLIGRPFRPDISNSPDRSWQIPTCEFALRKAENGRGNRERVQRGGIHLPPRPQYPIKHGRQRVQKGLCPCHETALRVLLRWPSNQSADFFRLPFSIKVRDFVASLNVHADFEPTTAVG